MTEYIITRCGGGEAKVLGTVQASNWVRSFRVALKKWWIKPNQFFNSRPGTRAEIAFARDMEAEGILADMEFEELMEGILV